MTYAEKSPKEKRIIERDIETLFSPKAFLKVQTIEDIKQLFPFHPSITLNGGIKFLSEGGIAAFRRLAQSIAKMRTLENVVSAREIEAQMQKDYSLWIDRRLQPSGHEFVEGVVSALLKEVKHFEFLLLIDGVDLKDREALVLGSFRIQRSNPDLFNAVKFGKYLDRDTTYSNFPHGMWLIGAVTGSPDVASEQFEYRAELIVGILGICGAVLYKGSIWRSRAQASSSAFSHRKTVSVLRWEADGKNPSLTRKWGREQNLPFTTESITYLNETCYLEQLAALPEIKDRSELQDAIVRAIYWFADAYKDRITVMQFVKLWTCLECFFAIDKREVTELNAKGVSAILTFAGFQIVDPKDYAKLKRRVKTMYDLRSTAIHRAEFGHVAVTDLEELSHWVAWIIISMASLVEKGFKTLKQVHDETSRLDALTGRTVT